MRPCYRKNVFVLRGDLSSWFVPSNSNIFLLTAGKALDIIKPENNPQKPVINWASIRENRAKYESMKWAG